MSESQRWRLGKRFVKKAEAEAKYIKQTGGRGQYGHVVLTVEPAESGKGLEFINKTVGGSIPREFIPAIEKGVKERLDSGVIAGYPLRDVRVTVIDGSFHDVDSNEMAFKIAGSMAFLDACKRADPVLLEPIMKVEVVVPQEFYGRCDRQFEWSSRQDSGNEVAGCCAGHRCVGATQ